ncbi:hypothetical protein BX070DRAFT_221148 [Coemansia spiralis]|nr:hypothetical protein BX070DRAFT_221148 [Coemansia spiralis]
MKSEIAQVEGCSFTTDELQRFHSYYKFSWDPVGLDGADVNERIRYFVTHVDQAIDAKRLREWLRTMGIVDSSELSDEAKLYDRFENFEFATAPGFNKMLGDVYSANEVDKYEIDLRIEKAKAQYYSTHMEPLDYEAYKAFKEANTPKPVCPYQHMWENSDNKRRKSVVDAKGFANIKVVDLADFFDSSSSDTVELTPEIMGRIREDVLEAYADRYYALAVISSNCYVFNDGTIDGFTEPVFLPALLCEPNKAKATLEASIRLQIELRKLNQTKPVVVFASGKVDQSALGILLSTADVVTTDMFCVKSGSTSETAQTFPLSALYDWAHLDNQASYKAGTAEYVLCNPDLIIRGSEFAALGFGKGFLSQRKLAPSMERIMLAASCPPPHTRDALRKAYVIESAYSGPSKINVWEQEIARYFAPLASGSKSVDDLIKELKSVQKPWATKYLAFAGDDSNSKAIAAVRVSALRSARSMEYSHALALELGATSEWSQGERSVDKLLSAKVTSSMLAASTFDSANDTKNNDSATGDTSKTHSTGDLGIEIPGECPFAQMYRKNPDRFKHIDLKAIAQHRALNM